MNFNETKSFYNNVHPVKGPIASRVKELQSKRRILWEYVENIKVDPTIEQIKILVIGKKSIILARKKMNFIETKN